MRYAFVCLLILLFGAPAYAGDDLAFLMRRGQASGSVPPIASFTISPTSVSSLPDNTAASFLLSTATVTMTGGGSFGGTLVLDQPAYYKIVGLQIQTARALNSADDGTHNTVITALNRACSPHQVLSPTSTVLVAQGHSFNFNSTTFGTQIPPEYRVVIDGSPGSSSGAALQVTGGIMYLQLYPWDTGGHWLTWNGSAFVDTGTANSPGPPDC